MHSFTLDSNAGILRICLESMGASIIGDINRIDNCPRSDLGVTHVRHYLHSQ